MNIASQPLPPWPKNPRRGVRVGKRHDFGAAGMLTISEASVLSGVRRVTIDDRMRRNVPIEQLLVDRIPNPSPGGHTHLPGRRYASDQCHLFAEGILLFRKYGMKPPTAAQIKADLGVSRAASYRKLQAYKDAVGLP